MLHAHAFMKSDFNNIYSLYELVMLIIDNTKMCAQFTCCLKSYVKKELLLSKLLLFFVFQSSVLTKAV